jgi:hypothetical protein
LSASTTSSYHHIDSVSSLQKELKECMAEVKRLEGKVMSSSKNNEELMIKKEEEAPATPLDGYFIHNNVNFKSLMPSA